MAFFTVTSLPSAARATYSSGPLSLTGFSSILLEIDINVTAITGGTSPTVTFKVSRIEPDGVLYQIWQPTALNAAGALSQSIGIGGQTNADPGDTVQIDMIVTGAPTSVTFSLTMKGRGA